MEKDNTKQNMKYFIRKNTIISMCFFSLTLFAQNNKATLDSPYGMCAHISRPALDYYLMKENLEALNNANVSWVRTDFIHEAIRDYKGTFYSPILDSVANYMTSNGKFLLPILDRSFNGYGWEDTLSYNKYVRFCVEHYSPKTNYWEVMNEPDLIRNVDDMPSKYFGLLKNIYPVIKKSNPNAIVLMGSLSWLSDYWLDKINEYQAYNYFDIVNLHSYAAPEANISMFKRLSDSMSKNKWNRPVWMTEMGMHTAIDTITNESFYSEALPQALEKLNISRDCKVAIIRDYYYGYHALSSDEVERYCGEYKEVKYIALDELNAIDVVDVPVLFASSQEMFPYQFWNNIVDYVRRGGTLVLAYSMPFYYNLKQDGTFQQVGIANYRDIHMSVMLWWSSIARKMNVPEKPIWAHEVGDFSLPRYKKIQKKLSARYLTTDNLKQGDQFISMLEAGNEDYSGSLVGIYKLDSDLKGNIIVSMRQDLPRYVNKEKEQARRVAREHIIAFSMGVDKVFWYNLRALERNSFYSEDNYGLLHSDFSPKPAYIAYKTMTQMLPDGSTRPSLDVIKDCYISSWLRPDGVKVCGIWTTGASRYVGDLVGEYEYAVDYMGNVMPYSGDKEIVSNGITYFVSGGTK